MGMREKSFNIAIWMLQALAALVFVGAGSGKLFGRRDMVGLFDAINVGQWLRYVTGGCEVVGALLLLVPNTAALGAGLLACVMIVATVVHVTVLQTSPAEPLVLLVVTVVIAWGRRTNLSISKRSSDARAGAL
jgi:putative oxidoreductase